MRSPETQYRVGVLGRLIGIAIVCISAGLAGCKTMGGVPGKIDPSIADPTRSPTQDRDVVVLADKSGRALVCSTPKGRCFTPNPVPVAGACKCASSDGEVRGTAQLPTTNGEDVQLAAIVPVLYATDRNYDATGDLGDRYGGERGAAVSYGTVNVSIPATHQTGVIEGAVGSSFVRIKFLENAAKHVLLTSVNPLSEGEFFGTLNGRLASSDRPDALVFVHGFNVTFTEGAKRAAQISYDLGFLGSTVLFSWPSKGSPTPLGYTADSNTIRWSQPNLTGFLRSFLAKTTAKRIYLVAHSMGTQAMSGAVADLATLAPADRARIKEVVLAAPDIDADIFKRDIAPAMVRLGAPITIYASSDDRALMLSRQAAARPRVGDNTADPIVMVGIETVDATGMDTSFLAHSTFASTKLLIQDWQ